MPTAPEPDRELSPLAGKLAAGIRAGGPITFHDYIEACLFDPDFGYYRRKDPLGEGGDFITAPEISQIFGELIGLWAGEMWRLMGEPQPIRLIELGPGRGTLMADALRALKVLPKFLGSATVHLIEKSEPLRDAQKARLDGMAGSIDWHEAPDEVPDGASIVIANEFFDCLPVSQFVFVEAERCWRERMVAWEHGQFKFSLGTESWKDFFAPIEDGSIIEVRPAVFPILRTLAERAANAAFAALIIDYGYAKPSSGDTVQAVRNHRFAGIFDAPGETDLTAHVDFPDIVRTACALDLKASGPMPMGEWLLRLGAEARLAQLLRHATETEAQEATKRVARLIDPAQMGALFKVLVLASGGLPSPPPFL